MKSRKATFNTKLFTYIMALLVVAILILLFFKWRGDLESRERESRGLLVDEKIKSVAETLLFGQVKKATFEVEPGTKVCFFDSRREKRDLIYNDLSIPIIRTYPEIGDLLDPASDVERNVFYIDTNEQKFTKSRWVPDICFDDSPYYVCLDSRATTLEVWFEGKGKCTSIWSTWRRDSKNNKKNLSMYPDNQLFLAWDQDDDHTNWPNILSLVPVTLWTSDMGTQVYPYALFYHDTTIIEDDILQIMEDRDDSNVSYIMGPSPIEVNGEIGTSGSYIYNITSDTYLKFWESFDQVVISSKENKSMALKAALTAAAQNAPVIFMDTDSVGPYTPYFTEKDVYLFTSGEFTSSVIDTIHNEAYTVIYVGVEEAEEAAETMTLDNLPGNAILYSLMSKVS